MTDARFVKIQHKADVMQRELPIYNTVMGKIGKTHRVQYMHAGCTAGYDRTGQTRIDHESDQDSYPRRISGSQPESPGYWSEALQDIQAYELALQLCLVYDGSRIKKNDDVYETPAKYPSF